MKPAEQERPDVVELRTAFRQTVAARRPEDLVFIDEGGIATELVRLYGRAPEGERAVGQAPYGWWERLTVPGGLSLAGLVACMSVDGAADIDVVLAFMAHVLVPALRPG